MSGPVVAVNRHPAVMFEIIAEDQAAIMRFYAQVFGWTYRIGTGGFAYIDFPLQTVPLLGGIGQAQQGVPGFEPGHNFYLQVDSLEDTLAAVEAAGGTLYMPIASVDGYRFAMFQDPAGNPVGLIEPFAPVDPVPVDPVPVAPVLPIEPPSPSHA